VDFSFSEDQETIRELARQILSDQTSPERSRELEDCGDWYDRKLWTALAEANLTALCLPEEVGGAGAGFFELAIVLEEAGRALAPVPLIPTLALAGLPIAEFGTPEQRERWLGPVAQAEGILTAAFHEVGSHDPGRARVAARRDGDGWRLSGEKICVPAAHLANAILVPAQTNDGIGVFLVEPGAEGVTLERQLTTNREPQSRLLLDGARAADAIGEVGRGAEIVAWTVARGTVALCAQQLGLASEALRRTAEYTSQRKQFGRPIATFQAVALRAADAFIDLEAMRSTLWKAAWRLSEGLPAEAQVAAAKWWACTGGHRVVHTAQHLHGGIGSDVDYPIHRYMLWAKQAELSLGGASAQVAKLGRLLVEARRQEA
jgi:alkylation response protein AidB-like acyl-CoA dehydrogenase